MGDGLLGGWELGCTAERAALQGRVWGILCTTKGSREAGVGQGVGWGTRETGQGASGSWGAIVGEAGPWVDWGTGGWELGSGQGCGWGGMGYPGVGAGLQEA